MFDAHCHLEQIKGDIDAVLERAAQQGVLHMLCSGFNPEGWQRQLKLICPTTQIALGLHPWAVAAAPQNTQNHLLVLRQLLADGRWPVSAIGETGLDFGKRTPKHSKAIQIEAFHTQIKLSMEYELPLILHVVSAHQKAIDILKDHKRSGFAGMVHAFSGSTEILSEYLKLGFHISFCGSIMDPKRRKARHAAARVPLHRLLVETDSPDQTPITRRPGPNEPAFLIDVITTLAKLRGQASEDIASITMENAKQLFKTDEYKRRQLQTPPTI